jgi:para-aminobenzoate synthetase/4-amino-4-deoxychorismate lyase
MRFGARGEAEARFDDLTPGRERSFRMVGHVGTVEAHGPDEIAPALQALEAAAGSGQWCAGFVCYEAAPGLDGNLTVRPRPARDEFAALPLLWFAAFEGVENDPLPERVGASATSGWVPSVDRTAYDAAIERIREHIEAGDTYQVNHTLRLRSRFEGDALALYRDLCLAQRGGYASYMVAGRYSVLSASPELFFRLDGDRVTTRPMKGTAPRGRWLQEDETAAERLSASAKDRAENAMIVDLIRNDLGRISEPGSVRVNRMFETERYETVWQLTSTATSRLLPATSIADVFRALFPSGSVTGAPKVATMRIIAQLEDSPRGVYCGAIGYLAPPGSREPRANFSVAIRTVVVDSETRAAEYGVGGGITHDSSAAGEYQEVLAKARVLTERRPPFALFETLRLDGATTFVHLNEHLHRLGDSAAYFGFRFDPEAAVSTLEKAAAEAGGEARVRLTLERDGSMRAEVGPVPRAPRGPVRVALDDEPVDPNDVWLFHKTTRREPYERRKRRRPDVDDVLLINERGEVTESTVANLAVRIEGMWVTPPLDCGLLAGTYRRVLVRQGRLTERTVGVIELREAEDLALVSSVRGWRPAVVVP